MRCKYVFWLCFVRIRSCTKNTGSYQTWLKHKTKLFRPHSKTPSTAEFNKTVIDNRPSIVMSIGAIVLFSYTSGQTYWQTYTRKMESKESRRKPNRPWVIKTVKQACVFSSLIMFLQASTDIVHQLRPPYQPDYNNCITWIVLFIYKTYYRNVSL